MKKTIYFNILTCFTLVAFLFQSTPASGTETPSDVVAAFQDNLLAVMKEADQLDVRGRFDRLNPGIESSFHVPFMVQIATGRHWKLASREERRDLVSAFRRMSIATLATLFNKYNGETFRRTGEKSGPKKTTLVKTELVRVQKPPIKITYVVGKFKSSWRIIDVILGNKASELKVRISEYNKTLNESGVPGLINLLNGKADELMAQ